MDKKEKEKLAYDIYKLLYSFDITTDVSSMCGLLCMTDSDVGLC